MKSDSFDIRGYAPDVDPMDDSLPNDDEKGGVSYVTTQIGRASCRERV